MKESYELVEAKGNDGEIHYVEIAIHFEQDGKTVTNYSGGPLPASIDAEADHETIIQCGLNALGARRLKEIRDEARNKLSSTNESQTVYYSSKNQEVQQCYVRLALIECGLWKSFKAFIDSITDERTITMINYAPTWKKSNKIFLQALGGDRALMDDVFARARELQIQSSYNDVFDG